MFLYNSRVLLFHYITDTFKFKEKVGCLMMYNKIIMINLRMKIKPFLVTYITLQYPRSPNIRAIFLKKDIRVIFEMVYILSWKELLFVSYIKQYID